MPTFKLTLEYDGTRYHGWQIQPNLPTIQAELEASIRHIVQAPTDVIGAGRTDAGVHALGQVAHFRTGASLSAIEWLRALNGLLPTDIAVLSVEEMLDTFHARFSAKSKLYRYCLLTRPHRSALSRTKALHFPQPLDIRSMQEASVSLLGEHDYSSFQGSPTDTKSPICNVSRLTIECFGDELRFDIEANRFLKQMVRSIVGTLLEIGRGRFQVNKMREILAAKDRRAAGPTVPAHGLYLVRVHY